MAAQMKTPGVYIVEQNAFPNSVVQVATAVPAFIGYTEMAAYEGKLFSNRAIQINSLADYEMMFGKGPGAGLQFSLDTVAGGMVASPLKPIVALEEKQIVPGLKSGVYRLYHSMRLFYLNGGASCYIISVGNYSNPHLLAALSKGLTILQDEMEPTMIVIPDAVSLPAADHASLVQLSLAHCEQMQNRVAIVDVYDGAVSDAAAVDTVINEFRNGTGNTGLSYGAAYFPWLVTGIVQRVEINFMNLPADLGRYLENTDSVKQALEPVTVLRSAPDIPVTDAASTVLINKAHTALLAASKYYHQIIDAVFAMANILPPSAAMAGMYTLVDSTQSISKAPANIALAAVMAPTINLTDTQQMGLNFDAVTGKSVNALRAFAMKGVLVWGARTLDGNSEDWRYINVRRTLIMIEQSVKTAVKAYVFEPNDANTWVTVKSMIENFLTRCRQQGILAGARPELAFSVDIGLGSTMTAQDIPDGYMRITVKVAVSHPAEFIVISFEQEMQKA